MDRLSFTGVFLSTALAVVMTAIALASLTPEDTSQPPYSTRELKKLEQGEVVVTHRESQVSETEQSSTLVASVLINHPAEVIWKVLDHPEREVEWIPLLKKSAVVSDKRPTPSTRVNVTDYRFSVFGMEVYYSLVREYD